MAPVRGLDALRLRRSTVAGLRLPPPRRLRRQVLGSVGEVAGEEIIESLEGGSPCRTSANAPRAAPRSTFRRDRTSGGGSRFDIFPLSIPLVYPLEQCPKPPDFLIAVPSCSIAA